MFLICVRIGSSEKIIIEFRTITNLIAANNTPTSGDKVIKKITIFVRFYNGKDACLCFYDGKDACPRNRFLYTDDITISLETFDFMVSL